jgi:Ran GTPase-activating protein (RanGAP) involved in mRNA processing and transport
LFFYHITSVEAFVLLLLQVMGSLEHVAMPQNGIQHEGIEALAGAFAECKNLKVLNLNDNIFTADGASAIARVSFEIISHLV